MERDKVESTRASAERAREEAERQYQTSEYPRYGRSVHLGVAAALDELAAWLEENGTEPPTGDSRYETRKLGRVYWLRRKALETKVESARLSAQSHDMGSSRPLGQPLVGSPARRRAQANAIERERRKNQKAFEVHNEAAELNRRANAAERNTSISSQDPEALDKLRAKLATLEAQRDAEKASRPKAPPILNYRQPEGFQIENRYHSGQFDHYDQIDMTKAEWKRKAPDYKATRVVGAHRVRTAMHNEGGRNGLTLVAVFLTDSKEHPKPEPATMEAPTTGTDAIRERMQPWSRALLNKEIKRLKDRIIELEAREDYEERPERMIGNVRVVDNTEFHKVELWFPGKPSEETRRLIKGLGFRWIRSVGCWSRGINNRTEYALERLAEHLREEVAI